MSAPIYGEEIMVEVVAPLPAGSNVIGTVLTQSAIEAATLIFGSATAAGSTTLGTPPANSNLRKLRIEVTENATLAAAGEDTITIALDGVTVFETQVFIPAVALATAGTLYAASEAFDHVAFNAGAAGTLTASLGTALATGAVLVNAWFD